MRGVRGVVLLQMNLRSVKDVSRTGARGERNGDGRTFPIRGVYSNGLDSDQDLIITGHRDGHLLNQRGAVLDSDRHQSLRRLRKARRGGPTGWVTTAFMRGGTSGEDMRRRRGGWGSERASAGGVWVAERQPYIFIKNERPQSNLCHHRTPSGCHQTRPFGNCELEGRDQ